MVAVESGERMTTPTTTAFESLRLHYERDAERFLLPALTDVRACAEWRPSVTEPTKESDR